MPLRLLSLDRQFDGGGLWPPVSRAFSHLGGHKGRPYVKLG